MTKKNEMVKIWFDDMEEMFQIKLSEWDKLRDNALPPYNNHSEHHFASASNDFEWFENSNLEYMYHRIKMWREGYGYTNTQTYRFCGWLDNNTKYHNKGLFDYFFDLVRDGEFEESDYEVIDWNEVIKRYSNEQRSHYLGSCTRS